MGKELMLDNYGMCRFHRGWAEGLLPEIVDRFQKTKVDSVAHHLKLARELNGMNQARPWETERVLDIVRTYLEKVRRDGPKDERLDRWVDRFSKDKREAGAAYWQEMREGFDAALAPSRA
jgi:glyceraldehyde-3-phosphate dehydrogenase (ferredoxin)